MICMTKALTPGDAWSHNLFLGLVFGSLEFNLLIECDLCGGVRPASIVHVEQILSNPLVYYDFPQEKIDLPKFFLSRF